MEAINKDALTRRTTDSSGQCKSVSEKLSFECHSHATEEPTRIQLTAMNAQLGPSSRSQNLQFSALNHYLHIVIEDSRALDSKKVAM